MFTLIFDTETTGLPKSWSSPLSDINNWPRLVSLSFIITDGTYAQEFDYIIKPEGFEIPPEASKIHGIDTERALGEGYDLSFVLGLFRAFVNLADKVVAHNISFDEAIVGCEYYRLGLGQPFETRWKEKDKFCTMKKAPGFGKWPKLSELHQKLFNEGFDGAHNSLMDTRACARCYFELVK